MVEIKPCLYDIEQEQVVFTSDDVAEFYGVYRINSDNSLTHLKDFATKSGAERYVNRLKVLH